MSYATQQRFGAQRASVGRIVVVKTGRGIQAGVVTEIGDDDRPMFYLRLQDDGNLEVLNGSFCEYNNILFGDKLQIVPRAENLIYIRKSIHK